MFFDVIIVEYRYEWWIYLKIIELFKYTSHKILLFSKCDKNKAGLLLLEILIKHF